MSDGVPGDGVVTLPIPGTQATLEFNPDLVEPASVFADLEYVDGQSGDLYGKPQLQGSTK